MPTLFHTFFATWLPVPDPAPHKAYDRPATVLGAAVCGLLVGLALQVSYGVLDDIAMYILSLALLAGLLGIAAPPKPRYDAFARRVLPGVLTVGLILQLALCHVGRPGMQVLVTRVEQFVQLHALLSALAVIGLMALGGFRPMVRWHVACLVFVAILLGDWIITVSPSPRIDLIPLHREALSALLSGKNPFAITFPNIYDSTIYYGAGLVKDGRVMFGYDYPPINLLMALPGVVLGDFRYAMVLALAFGVGLIAKTRSGAMATLGALLLLTTPRWLMVLECGWIEPLGFLLLAAALFWSVHRPRLVPLALGLLLVSKQHMFIILPTAWLLPIWHGPRAQRLRMLTTLLAVGALVTLPFFLWSPSAFWHSVVEVMLEAPFRPDSLNFAAWINSFSDGEPPSMWLGFALGAVAMTASFGRLPRTPAGFAMALGFVFFCFLTFNRQAFWNYYWFIIACMFAAVALSEFADEAQPGEVAHG